MKRVLLTGAFGNVGANALAHLHDQGYEIFAFDVQTGRNKMVATQLATRYRFTPIWGDLRSAEAVETAVSQAKPHAILHVAAVIAPTAYLVPQVAYDVNVNGTRLLLEAAQKMAEPPQFVFTSSYSVNGPRNPHRNLSPLTGDTPVNPGDNYGRHKVAGEELVQASSLPWTIVRLPAVIAISSDWGQAPEFLQFAFLLPLDRREHAIDSRDAGLALVNAIGNERANGRIFTIGGPEGDCRLTGHQLMAAMGEARGIAIPPSAFRLANPDLDESWYYEDWVDTRESQEILQYQQHRFADTLAYIKEQSGIRRHLLKLLSRLIGRQVVKQSPYYGQPPKVSSETVWKLVCQTFEIDPRFR